MNVHLVGSIGLDSVEEVSSTVGGLLGKHLRRVLEIHAAAAQ